MSKQILTLVVLVAVLALAISACAPVVPPIAATAGDGSNERSRVYFVEPRDGATTSSPVLVTMGGEFFTIEPAGSVHPGAGHLHIMVDTECVAAGNVVPKDEMHLHYGGGQLTTELELAPGEHTLCLQAADGAHIALPGEGMTETITLVVE